MKISHPFLRLLFLAFAAGAGWLVVWSFPLIMKMEDITSKIIAMVVCVGLFGCFALYLLAWTFFYDRMENRERQRKADAERKERRKPAKEQLAEARKEQRSERNANYILGAVAVATAIYFLLKKEWLVAALMVVVAVSLFYKAVRNIEPAKIKQKREEATRRQEVESLMETAKDDGAVIIVDHVDSLTAIEDAIEAFGEEYHGRKNGRNAIRLWQLEREKYALTFPLGYQPEAPFSLMWELDGSGLQPRGWFPSHRMKTQGGWTMLTVAESGATHAVTDNGCCYEDECNFHLRICPKLHLTYQPRPNIMNDSPKKLEDFI
jgi:membrane protein implicated in regulation of membrane protease activity